MNLRRIQPIEERFWRRVSPEPNSGCWLWDGALANGYPVLQRGKRGEGIIKVHRLSLILAGIDVPDDLFVCHRCDVPMCVNPDHLFVGTQSDNLRDMHQKGRRDYSCLPRGNEHWTKKKPDRLPRGDQHWTRRRACAC